MGIYYFQGLLVIRSTITRNLQHHHYTFFAIISGYITFVPITGEFLQSVLYRSDNVANETSAL